MFDVGSQEWNFNIYRKYLYPLLYVSDVGENKSEKDVYWPHIYENILSSWAGLNILFMGFVNTNPNHF